MAPTATAAMDPSQDLSLCHKLRKPVVEKLRRERINSSSSIVQQLNSKLRHPGDDRVLTRQSSCPRAS
uniref:Uncharacterized protein n=1 Tax=Knipowitschia caucasica TaxID=637954 RepID=A0AAV2M704_KNICA